MKSEERIFHGTTHNYILIILSIWTAKRYRRFGKIKIGREGWKYSIILHDRQTTTFQRIYGRGRTCCIAPWYDFTLVNRDINTEFSPSSVVASSKKQSKKRDWTLLQREYCIIPSDGRTNGVLIRRSVYLISGGDKAIFASFDSFPKFEFCKHMLKSRPKWINIAYFSPTFSRHFALIAGYSLIIARYHRI